MPISYPSDIAGYEALLGTRLLRAAYAGNCLRIRRSSDSTEQDIGFSGGVLDTAAIATFIGGGSGFLVTWYDQSGAGNDFTQATTTKQPLYVASGINGLPTFRWDGTDDLLRCGTVFSSATAGSLFITYQLSTTPAATQAVFGTADEAGTVNYFFAQPYGSTQKFISIQQRSATNNWVRGALPVIPETVYVGTWKSTGTAWEFRVNSMTQDIVVLGGTNNGDWFGDTANRDSFTIGCLKRTTEAFFFKGDISEIILYDSDLSDADTLDVETYSADYWRPSRWSIKEYLPVGSADLPTVPYSGKIYGFGGYDTAGSVVHNDTQIYTPGTDSWAAGTDMTTARWGAAAAVFGDYVYVFGGATDSGGTRSAKVERYDIAGNSWSTMTDLPGATFGNQGIMAVTVGSLIYLFYLTEVYEFDPAGAAGLGSYTALATAPVSRTWAVCAYVDVGGEDRIYLIGGAASGGSTATNVNYYYRPGSDDWSAAQTVAPYPAWGVIRDNPVYSGLIYYGSGQTSSNIYTNQLYSYDPSTDTWSSALDRATVPRDGVGCAVVGTNLHIIGGRANGVGFDFVEAYDLSEEPAPSGYIPRPSGSLSDGIMIV